MPSASIDEGVGVDANDDGRMEEGAVELGGPGDAPNHEGVPHPHAGQKPGSAVFNLSSAIIGAGIMAIPNAFRVLGVLGGVLALVAMHVVTGTTVRFLVRATEASGAGTYAACAARFCGDAARTAVQLAIVLNNFGIMVVYQIIFGDVLAGTPADLRTLPDVDPGPGSDAEDYADYDDGRDNATRVYPPPLPPAAPPSDEDDEDAAPAALLPWAPAQRGGIVSGLVPPRLPNGAGTRAVYLRAALAVPDDGAIGWGESSDTFIGRALDGWAVQKNGGNVEPNRHSQTQVAYETAWYCTRPASIAYVLVLVCAPLCLMRSLKALAGASFASVACAANFAAVLLFKFVMHVVEEFGNDTAGDTAGAGVFGKLAALTPRLLPDPTRTSVREAISVIAVMTTAYVCHFVVHPLYAEMDHPRSPERFEALVARRSLRLCTSIYVGVGVVAFALFGDGTHADVLVDFRRNTALDQAVVKGGYVASLALTYPVLFCVMREVLVEIFMDRGDAAKRRSGTTTDADAAGDDDDRYGDRYGDEATSDELCEHLLTDAGEEERADGDEVAHAAAMRDSRVSLRDPEECAWRLSRPAHVALTLSIIAAQFLLAIVIPDIEVALGFMGSTLSVFVAFAAPAMIAIGVAKEAGADGSLAWAVLAFGVLVGASGLTVATWNVVSPPE